MAKYTTNMLYGAKYTVEQYMYIILQNINNIKCVEENITSTPLSRCSCNYLSLTKCMSYVATMKPTRVFL